MNRSTDCRLPAPGLRRLGIAVLLALVALTAGGCTTQQRGQLEVRLLYAGDPLQRPQALPEGSRVLVVDVEATNVGPDKVNAWYTDSGLYLYDLRGNEIRTWTGPTVWATTHRGPSVETTNVLRPDASVRISRAFVVPADQHPLKAELHLPGHGSFTWYVW